MILSRDLKLLGTDRQPDQGQGLYLFGHTIMVNQENIGDGVLT